MRLVRSIALCAAFLLVLSAEAQLLGPEVRSTPFTPQSGIGIDTVNSLTGIARLGESAVVVWPVTTNNLQRILLARLDGQLQAVAARELPLLDPKAEAQLPSIASNGRHVVVVWTESLANVVAAVFDRDLNVLQGPAPLLQGNFRGHATNNGEEFAVVANNVIFRFTEETFSNPKTEKAWSGAPLLGPFDEVVVSPTYGPQMIGVWTTRTQTGGCSPCWWRCPPPPCPPVRYIDETQISFLTLYQTPRTWKPGVTATFRSMSAGSSDTLAIWRTDNISSPGALAATLMPGDTKTALPSALRLDVLPEFEPGSASATWDGERYAVVWQIWRTADDTVRQHGIAFATIENGAIAQQTLLFDGPDDEIRPSIIATGAGRYIVAYESVSKGEHRIAGRLVSLQQDARRRPSGK